MTCSDVRELKEARARIVELELERDEFKAHCAVIKSVISPSAVGLIKCGIGGNYGGIYYDEKLEQVYEPVVKALEQTPKQSLAEIKAKAIEYARDRLLGFYTIDCMGDMFEKDYKRLTMYANQIRTKEK